MASSPMHQFPEARFPASASKFVLDLYHFAAAKQGSTRVARIENAMPAILAGRGFLERPRRSSTLFLPPQRVRWGPTLAGSEGIVLDVVRD